ncbi:hypothetical protein, partial [Aetokthonos hydrillicola]
MRIFTIVSRPNYQDPKRYEEWKYFFLDHKKQSFSTRLTNDKNPLGEAVNTLRDRSLESEFFLKLTHPDSPNLSTVCIWKHQERDNIYYVKNVEYLTAFDSTNNKNRLYLPPLRGKNLINFRNINDDQNYRYQVMEVEELGFPNSLASQKNDA